MKKVLKNLKVPSSLLIFLAIFAISIFGLQISKIYAQNSKLSNTLFIKDLAILNDNLTVSGSLGVGKAANSTYSLDVNSPANFNSRVLGVTPGSSQTNALATVAYINSKIAQIPKPIEKVCPPPVICPTCPACDSCCGTSPPANPECIQVEDMQSSCDGPMPQLGLGVICPDSLHFGGYVADSCNRPADDYWRFKCCPSLPRP